MKGKFFLFFIITFLFVADFAIAGSRKDNTSVSSPSSSQAAQNLREVLSSTAEPSRAVSQDIINRIAFVQFNAENSASSSIVNRVEESMHYYWTRYSMMDVYYFSQQGVFGAAVISENLNIANIDMGNLPQVGYFFRGSVRRTSQGYDLYLYIQYADGRSSPAIYRESHTEAQINDLSAMKQATLRLLRDMGISTARAQAELSGASQQNEIDAANARARALADERTGANLSSINNYLDAVIAGGLTDYLSSRISSLSRIGTSGGFGEAIRQDFQRREEWRQILEKAETYFNRNMPYSLGYSDLLPINHNYQNNTVDLAIDLQLLPSEGFDVLRALQEGLNAEGRGTRDQWGFSQWPMLNTKEKDLFSGDIEYTITLQLVNERGVELGRKQVIFNTRYYMTNGLIYGNTANTRVVFEKIRTDLLPDNSTPRIYVLREAWKSAKAQKVQQARQNYVGFPFTVGAGLAPTGFLFNFDAELGFGKHIFDAGFTVDFGSQVNEELHEKGIDNKFIMGITFGYSFGIFHDSWFISIGLGGIYSIVADLSSSSNSNKYRESSFVPYLKSEFDYMFSQNFSFRLGYRLELFQSKVYDRWFTNAQSKSPELGSFKMRHVIYGGIVFYM